MGSPDANLVESLRELAYGCRILSQQGHADLTLGHLSVRDEQGHGVWIKRGGIGLGEVADENDFVLVDFSGRPLAGSGRPHKEWPIHTEILRARPDIRAVGHSHPFHATAFTALDVDLSPLTNDAAYLGGAPARFGDTSNLVDTPDLGAALARALGQASCIFMRNHGVSFVGATIAECVLTGVFLERACRAQLTLMATGQMMTATVVQDLREKRDKILDAALVEQFWSFFKRQADRTGNTAATA